MIEIVTLAVLIIFGILLCIALAVISGHLEDLSSGIAYIKNWVSGQSLTMNAFDIVRAINEAKSDLMVEMACVGAKNNADILRLKDGFQVGDVIDLEGVRYFVTKRITKAGSNGSLAGYMVVRNDGTSEYWGIEDIDSGAKFIKHLDGFDDAFS